MNWLQTQWNDRAFRWLTYFCSVLPFVFNLVWFLMSDDLSLEPFVFFWGFYLLIVLPLSYLFRNVK